MINGKVFLGTSGWKPIFFKDGHPMYSPLLSSMDTTHGGVILFRANPEISETLLGQHESVLIPGSSQALGPLGVMGLGFTVEGFGLRLVCRSRGSRANFQKPDMSNTRIALLKGAARMGFQGRAVTAKYKRSVSSCMPCSSVGLP